ncbi:glycosyltransferase [Microbacterium trichothecenolyticum]|uniref:glycosyltransferase n=1 Tax=Microbacterium trichothecenolyticum TaxID=69370 RepID=UPI0035BE605E
MTEIVAQKPSEAFPWILVLGTAEWDSAIATNQHYMAQELARSNRVTFVESMGLRRPELRPRDLRRIVQRLGRIISSRTRGSEAPRAASRPIPPNLEVLSPFVVPLHVGWVRTLNRKLLNRQLREWRDSAGTTILWAYTPATYSLETSASASFYHCVDLLGDVPGISKELIAAEESRLASDGVPAAGSSEVVVEHLRRVGFQEVHSWLNVADVVTIESTRPAKDNRIPRSAVFAGNLSATKVDFTCLRELQNAGWHIHLAGPISEGGGDAAALVQDLVNAGATYHGLLSLAELGALYWRCSVGLIPYVINDYTRGVNPLKTYEYLAAGLPVVTTAIPAVVPRDGDVLTTTTTKEFVDAVNSTAVSPDQQDRRIAIARANSWSHRGEVARQTAEDLIARRRYVSSEGSPSDPGDSSMVRLESGSPNSRV